MKMPENVRTITVQEAQHVLSVIEELESEVDGLNQLSEEHIQDARNILQAIVFGPAESDDEHSQSESVPEPA